MSLNRKLYFTFYIGIIFKWCANLPPSSAEDLRAEKTGVWSRLYKEISHCPVSTLDGTFLGFLNSIDLKSSSLSDTGSLQLSWPKHTDPVYIFISVSA